MSLRIDITDNNKHPHMGSFTQYYIVPIVNQRNTYTISEYVRERDKAKQTVVFTATYPRENIPGLLGEALQILEGVSDGNHPNHHEDPNR